MINAEVNITKNVIGYEVSYALNEKSGSVKKKLNVRTLKNDEIKQNQRFEVSSDITSTPRIYTVMIFCILTPSISKRCPIAVATAITATVFMQSDRMCFFHEGFSLRVRLSPAGSVSGIM